MNENEWYEAVDNARSHERVVEFKESFEAIKDEDFEDITEFARDFRDFDGDGRVLIFYLGRYFYLDPCGRYHHFLSPNGMQPECEAFWTDLEEAAEEAGGWLESGEGDPTDIFFSKVVEVENDAQSI